MRLVSVSMLIAVLMSGSFGCGTTTIQAVPTYVITALQKGEVFEVYSLNPHRTTEKPPNDFHGWEVLGSTKIEGADVHSRLIAALKKGAAENDGRRANCFKPRHGIRVVHGGKSYDLVICFECLQVVIYVDDERVKGFLVTDSPQPVFDKVLTDAKVKLPEEPE